MGAKRPLAANHLAPVAHPMIEKRLAQGAFWSNAAFMSASRNMKLLLAGNKAIEISYCELARIMA